jgi:hypothetical protein
MSGGNYELRNLEQRNEDAVADFVSLFEIS